LAQRILVVADRSPPREVARPLAQVTVPRGLQGGELLVRELPSDRRGAQSEVGTAMGGTLRAPCAARARRPARADGPTMASAGCLSGCIRIARER
jgi:hypothetical protein